MRELNLKRVSARRTIPALRRRARHALRSQQLSLTIEPAESSDTEYYLQAGIHRRCAVEIGAIWRCIIKPKIGIAKLLSLACYAIGKVQIRSREDFDFP